MAGICVKVEEAGQRGSGEGEAEGAWGLRRQRVRWLETGGKLGGGWAGKGGGAGFGREGRGGRRGGWVGIWGCCLGVGGLGVWRRVEGGSL